MEGGGCGGGRGGEREKWGGVGWGGLDRKGEFHLLSSGCKHRKRVTS